MKKIISLLLALTMVFALCACGQKEPEYDPEDAFKIEVNAAVYVEYLFVDNVKTATSDLTDIKVDGNIYTGKGWVTVRDVYDETYSGKMTAVYEYNEEDRSFTKISLDIDTLRKN